jgi:hypothetical protein
MAHARALRLNIVALTGVSMLVSTYVFPQTWPTKPVRTIVLSDWKLFGDAIRVAGLKIN